MGRRETANSHRSEDAKGGGTCGGAWKGVWKGVFEDIGSPALNSDCWGPTEIAGYWGSQEHLQNHRPTSARLTCDFATNCVTIRCVD